MAATTVRHPKPDHKAGQSGPSGRQAMSYGQGRFLTTHIGSLPRPEDLMELMWAREDGLPLVASAIDARVRDAVQEVVDKQVEAGVDIVNDGEMSKPSYATYIKDRLNGFGGTGNSFAFQDIEDFPGNKAKVFADPGRKHRKTPACNGPISVKDMDAVHADAANLKAALKDKPGAQPFMSAASPGVTAF